jgi:hypothetical protein
MDARMAASAGAGQGELPRPVLTARPAARPVVVDAAGD